MPDIIIYKCTSHASTVDISNLEFPYSNRFDFKDEFKDLQFNVLGQQPGWNVHTLFEVCFGLDKWKEKKKERQCLLHWHSMFVDHLLPMAMWRFGEMKFMFVYNNYNSCAQKIHKDLFHTNTSNSLIKRLGTIPISYFIYFLKTWLMWIWNQLQRPQINVVNPIEIDWSQTCEGLSLNLDSWEICLCAWS